MATFIPTAVRTSSPIMALQIRSTYPTISFQATLKFPIGCSSQVAYSLIATPIICDCRRERDLEVLLPQSRLPTIIIPRGFEFMPMFPTVPFM
jgi:hypothetical protein